MDADLHKVVFAESWGNPRGSWGQILLASFLEFRFEIEYYMIMNQYFSSALSLMFVLA